MVSYFEPSIGSARIFAARSAANFTAAFSVRPSAASRASRAVSLASLLKPIGPALAAGAAIAGSASNWSGSASRMPASRLVMVVNSIAFKNGNTSRASSGVRTSASSGSSTGTSRLSVTSFFEIRASSAFSSSDCAALGLLDLAGARQQRLDIPIGVDQLGRGLDPDARHARHVVDRVAAERLHLDHLVGRHAELFEHLLRPDPAQRRQAGPRNGVEQPDRAIGLDQLHQILVGRNDGHLAAGVARHAGIGGDDVVGLPALHLDRGQAVSLGGGARQRKLRHQLFRRRRPVRFVLGVDLVAEGLGRIVEHHRQMRWLILALEVFGELEDHVAKARNAAHRHAVALARQLRQRVKGPENEA